MLEKNSKTVERLMGCKVEELLTWLPTASNFKAFTVKQQMPIQIDFPQDGIKIEAIPQKSRQIALLEIPVLLVVFIFNEKWGSIEIAQFMKRFDIYTQRGGG
jgi:hypothetical protein